jgi:hypothetical protein
MVKKQSEDERIEEVKEFLSNELYVNDSKKLLSLTNKFLALYVASIDPRNYKTDREAFIKITLSYPAVISATVIDKIAGVFHLERADILDKFIDGVNLALKMIDKKNEI